MATRIFGSGIRRQEDPRLLTGTATYTDDLTLPGMDLGDDILGDIYASAEYRRAVAPVWVKRALTAAAARVA